MCARKVALLARVEGRERHGSIRALVVLGALPRDGATGVPRRQHLRQHDVGVWPGISQTVTLNGDVTIVPGATLTILAGTTITAAATDSVQKFGGTSLVDIFVDGTVNVQETVGSEVLFTGTGTGTATWGGIIQAAGSTFTAGSMRMLRAGQGFRVTAGAGPTTTLTMNNSTMGTGGCLRTLGTTGTTAYTLNNVTMTGCTGFAALDHGYGTMTVTGAVIRNTAGSGVYAHAPGLSVDRSTVAYNQGYGVIADCGAGIVTVTNAIVSHNSSQGFVRGYNCLPSGSLTMTQSGNVLWGNSGTHAATTATSNANVDGNNYGGGLTRGNAQSANPLFVDGPGGNLRLTSRSVARQPTGTDIGALPYTGDVTPGGLQGYIWADLTLSGPVSVVGDVVIPTGVTVTISPGATLTFAASDAQGSGTNSVQAEFYVLGTLQAIGTAVSQIVFTGTGSSSQWGGVRVLPGATASIAQARFERMAANFEVTAGTGPTTTLTMSNSTMATGTCLRTQGTTGTTAYTLNNVTMTGCTGFAALDHGYGTMTVTGAVIRNTAGSGVYAHSARAVG